MRAAAASGLAVCVGFATGFLAGCSGEERSGSPTRSSPEPGTLEALWRAPGEDVTLVPGAADFAPGRVRFSFLVVDGRGGVVSRPTARIWLARGLKRAPFAEATARLETIAEGGATPHSHRGLDFRRPHRHADTVAIFVTHLDVAKPGTYWVLAEPAGGRKIQALGNLVVSREPAAPAVGAKAPASKTPTLASAGGNLETITTQRPPDRELLRHSIADSLAAGAPFVVTFATPQYCTTRICGPVVDILGTVRRRFAGSEVRFLHVEIYRGNDPAKGYNQFVKAWRLPSEPFTFLVGGDGLIKARFEGAFSARELEAAVRKHLIRRAR